VGSFCKPYLLYGAEVWSLTPKGLQDLETAQTQGARRIFGKRAKATVINEALRGDLGWLSVQSQVAIAKLRFYGHMCRLQSSRLLKQVFLYRKWQHEVASSALNTRNFQDDFWHSEIPTIFQALGLSAADTQTEAVALLPKSAWNRKVEDLVRKYDSELLFANFTRTQSGSFYANIKQHIGQECYIWYHDRRSTLLKFYLRSRSYGLEARMHHGLRNASKKVCPFGTLQEHETEEHHLLRCTAFQPKRSIFFNFLRTASLIDFPVEIYEFVTVGRVNTARLLGMCGNYG
jgi:hypothetical protein